MSDSIKINFKKNFFKKLIIDFKFHHISSKLQELVKILSVSIFLDREIHQAELKTARELLENFTEDRELIEIMFEKIELNLDRYIEDEWEFIKDKEEIVKAVIEDIQLYQFVIQIFESDEHFSEFEKDFEILLKEEYNRKWVK